MQYLLKWAGYDDIHNTWEPIQNVSESLINDFERKQQSPKKKEKKGKKKNNKMVRVKEVPLVGDFCFAKVRGYAPWPAYVTKIQKNVIWVKFFNSTERYLIECTSCTLHRLFNGLHIFVVEDVQSTPCSIWMRDTVLLANTSTMVLSSKPSKKWRLQSSAHANR